MVVFTAPIAHTAVCDGSKAQNNRVVTHERISKKLASLTDQEIIQLLKEAQPLSTAGVTRTVFCLELDGTKIFVKKLCLTDLEKKTYGSTANIYQLPVSYHYGPSGVPFGSFREIKAHRITTEWVLSGKNKHFPLLYHARELTKTTLPVLEKTTETPGEFHYWLHHSKAVSDLHESIKNATSETVLFLEYIPKSLLDVANEQGINPFNTKNIKQIFDILPFMHTHGMLHFDLHPGNILTDGTDLYLTDFGAAMSSEFELSDEELLFFKKNADCDKGWVIYCMVEATLYILFQENHMLKRDLLQSILNEYITGNITTKVPEETAKMLKQYAPIAQLFLQFYEGFKKDTLPNDLPEFPEAELKKLLIAADLIKSLSENSRTSKMMHGRGKLTKSQKRDLCFCPTGFNTTKPM